MGKSSAFNLQDGGLYYGNLNSKGLPDSLDSIGMWDDGRRYIGQWVNGRVHGVGTMYYPDGSVIRDSGIIMNFYILSIIKFRYLIYQKIKIKLQCC